MYAIQIHMSSSEAPEVEIRLQSYDLKILCLFKFAFYTLTLAATTCQAISMMCF